MTVDLVKKHLNTRKRSDQKRRKDLGVGGWYKDRN